jgi:hypothetical protein
MTASYPNCSADAATSSNSKPYHPAQAGSLCPDSGIDAHAIIAAAEAIAPGRPIRHLGVVWPQSNL